MNRGDTGASLPYSGPRLVVGVADVRLIADLLWGMDGADAVALRERCEAVLRRAS